MVRPESYLLFDPPAARAHGKTYKEHARLFVDMEPHVDTLVEYAGKAKRILELGTRSGVSTWAFLTGLPEDGTIISVDFDERLMVEGWVPPQVTEDPRFRFIEADDTDHDTFIMLAETFPDIVFIDTSHTFAHTLLELTLYSQAVPEYFILHDYALDDVKNAVETFLVSNKDYEIEKVEESPWGLVILTNTRV